MRSYPVDGSAAGQGRPADCTTYRLAFVYFLALPLKQTIVRQLERSWLGNQHAEDIFEATISTALQHYDKLQASPNQLGWLYRTACYHILHLKRRSRRVIAWEDMPFDYPAVSPGDMGLTELLPRDIRGQDAFLLTLRYQYALPIRDIARILQLSDGAVKKRLSRLRIRMRGELNDDGQ